MRDGAAELLRALTIRLALLSKGVCRWRDLPATAAGFQGRANRDQTILAGMDGTYCTSCTTHNPIRSAVKRKRPPAVWPTVCAGNWAQVMDLMAVDKAGHHCCFRHTVLYRRFADVLVFGPCLSRWLMHGFREVDVLFCLGGSLNGKTKQLRFFCSSSQNMQKRDRLAA